jgi:SAM-dependent methyltransferase
MNKKEHWENVYKNKSAAQVSWYQQEPILSLNLINKYSPHHDVHIIDVGGGASTLCDYLLHYGYRHITVLDISTHAITQARQRLGDKSALIEWKVEDVTQFVPRKTFDLWHDRAVFHFLTDEKERERYRQVLEAAVAVGGHVIIAAFALGGPSQCSGLDIVQYDAEKLKTALGEKFSLLEQTSETHHTPTGQEQAFGYYVLVRNGK